MAIWSSVRDCVFLPVLLAASVASPATAQVRVGPLAGYSLLEHTDTSLTHGLLKDAASVGRTWLLGAVLDARLTPRDVVSAEFVWGPYHRDLDRYCITVLPTFACTPQVMNEASHALVADLQYARALGRSSWRPFVGGGFGLKRYSFKDTYKTPTISAAILMTAGVRSGGRRPLRLEMAALLVPRHPILNDKTQFELQARVVALVF
jgi:hypothetical protein